MFVSRTTRIMSPVQPGFTPCLPCRGNLRVDLVHGKLIQAGLFGALPRLLKPFRHEIMFQHLPGVFLR